MTDLDRAELRTLCERACLGAGARRRQAATLAEATVEAELRGRRAVGLSHLVDYLNGFRDGRIRTDAPPSVEQRTPVIVRVDCHGGLAQEGFALALDSLTGAATAYGLAALAVGNCFTVGELDHYTRRLNAAGLAALTCASSPALMSIGGAPTAVLGTNPLSFGMPLPGGRRLSFDQAASTTAWVSVRDAARRGEPLPPGWAVGPDGLPTTSAQEALAGALLPFGGYKGGNIALMVEVLATMAGAGFSCDAPPFDAGDQSPGVGMLVIALLPDLVEAGYPTRLDAQLTSWRDDWGVGVEAWTGHEEAARCVVPDALHDVLVDWAGRDES